jgi:hypothetical protein
MKRDSRATMAGIINEWKESGVTIKDFAQKKRMTKTKLQYWIRKLHPEMDQEHPFPAFLEISSGSSHIEASTKEDWQEKGKLQIELTFPSGLCLKIFG